MKESSCRANPANNKNKQNDSHDLIRDQSGVADCTQPGRGEKTQSEWLHREKKPE